MLELDVYDMDARKIDSVKVDEAVFGAAVNRPVLRQAVLMYRANRRAGTASAKNRNAVETTGKKPFRQKGTGRARQGSTVAPHHRGGGVAHGPRPRSYRQQMPRKMRQTALKSAYLDRLHGATCVLDALELDAPKTQAVAKLLRGLGIRGTCLIATTEAPEAVVKSVRNLAGVTVKRIRDVNAYDLLAPRGFVVTRAALESVIERFGDESATISEEP